MEEYNGDSTNHRISKENGKFASQSLPQTSSNAPRQKQRSRHRNTQKASEKDILSTSIHNQNVTKKCAPLKCLQPVEIEGYREIVKLADINLQKVDEDSIVLHRKDNRSTRSVTVSLPEQSIGNFACSSHTSVYAVETSPGKRLNVDIDDSDDDSIKITEELDDIEPEHNEIDDDTTEESRRIIVLGCNNTTKQVFDKKDSCYFCKKMVLSICLTRHFFNIHRNEKEVIEISQMKKNSLEKKHACQKLRNMGNFTHNASVLKNANGGNLIVVQRPLKSIEITNHLNKYSSCNKCLGYYNTSVISRHTCPSDPLKSHKSEHTKIQVIGLSHELKIFFSRMKNDNVTQTAASDSLITEYVSSLLLNKGMRNFISISEKTRALATFLMDYKQYFDKADLSLQELLKPENLDEIKLLILRKFEYNCINEKTSSSVTVQKPSTLIKLGQVLIQVSEVLVRHYLKTGHKNGVSNTENLIKLLNAELRPLMSNAHLTLNSANAGRPEELPAADDMSTLIDYVLKIIKNYQNMNERKVKYAAMTFLIIYNKRRSTEVSALSKKVWEERHTWKQRAAADLKNGKVLDAKQRKLLSSTELVYVRGKGNRFVPILFPKIIVPIIEYLANRTENYIFSNQAGKFIRGNDAMRNISKAAGLSQKCISSTKFRKLAATSLQVRSNVNF